MVEILKLISVPKANLAYRVLTLMHKTGLFWNMKTQLAFYHFFIS